jgi:flagellar motility protein MotE (MotC chaperone)
MEEKHRSKLANIFYIGIIPLLFTVILVAFLLNFMGFPVGKTFQEWGNQLPLINHLVNDPPSAEAEKPNDSDVWKNKYLKSESTVKEMDQKLSKYKKEISANQTELEDLKKNNEDLQNQLKSKHVQQSKEQMKQVADIYANMSASKAAAIFAEMSLEDASLTLMMLNQEQQSSILGGMKDPKKAAQITMMLKNIASISETDSLTLEQQVHELALQEENPTKTLSDTIAGMPPTQSAVIIQSMMGTNSIVAIDIMKRISTSSRAQILTEIAKIDAKLAAQITGELNK